MKTNKNSYALGEYPTTIQTEVRYKLAPELIEFQTWQTNLLSDKMEMLSKQMIDLRDGAVKSALAELGWTPPSVKYNERESYLRAELKRVRDDKNTHLKMYNELKEEVDSFREALRGFVKEEEEENG